MEVMRYPGGDVLVGTSLSGNYTTLLFAKSNWVYTFYSKSSSQPLLNYYSVVTYDFGGDLFATLVSSCINEETRYLSFFFNHFDIYQLYFVKKSLYHLSV